MQDGRYGLKAIIRIQKAGIAVAIAHLMRSHVWRFLIVDKRNWSVSSSACRSFERRRCAANAALSACPRARRLQILRLRALDPCLQHDVERFAPNDGTGAHG